ncbi:MAG: hypothetical protein C4331_04110 [Meiothermus sp.]
MWGAGNFGGLKRLHAPAPPTRPGEKAVFLGAESTGKSTLVRRMAEGFGTEFVAEYGREVYER